jgi:signal transduction histidine kinase
MLQTNGHPYTVLTLFTDDCPAWMSDVTSYLNDLDYQANIVRSTDDAWQLVQRQPPDALLAADNNSTLELFQAVRQTLKRDDHPLLVLLADYPPDERYQSMADIIAPPEPIYLLEHQLRTFMRLHSQNAKLTRTSQELRKELDLEKQSATGIELLKNAIVRNVAHELRTPLLQVKTAVALLGEDAGDTSTLVELAQRATTRLEAGVQNITLLNELINESLNRQDFEAVAVKEITDSAIRNLRRSWEHKVNVDRIKVHIPNNLPLVLGDKHRLVIALQLLIDNGLKFSKEYVEVNFRKVKNNVEFAIRDYGIGIPQDKIDKIFDTFYQVDNSTTKAYGGMGIGLAIVRFILERHNTHILVETEVGVGSTFSFSLPIADLNQGKTRSAT